MCWMPMLAGQGIGMVDVPVSKGFTEIRYHPEAHAVQ